MNYFDVTMGNRFTKWEHTEQEFGDYESLVDQMKFWCSKDSSRYGWIKFSNKLVWLCSWNQELGKHVEHTFQTVEEIAERIRNKK